MADAAQTARDVLNGIAVGTAAIPGPAGPIVSGLLRAVSALLHRRTPEEALAKLRELADEHREPLSAHDVARQAIEAEEAKRP